MPHKNVPALSERGFHNLQRGITRVFKKHQSPKTVIECDKHCVGLTDERAHALFHGIGEDAASALEATRPILSVRRNGCIKFVILPAESPLRRTVRQYCLHPSHLSADNPEELRGVLATLLERFHEKTQMRVSLAAKEAFGGLVYNFHLETRA